MLLNDETFDLYMHWPRIIKEAHYYRNINVTTI